jgi:hypothetical protein
VHRKCGIVRIDEIRSRAYIRGGREVELRPLHKACDVAHYYTNMPPPLSTHAQILDIVSRTRQEGAPPDVVVQRLLDASRERWLAEEPVIDDTTIIVAYC